MLLFCAHCETEIEILGAPAPRPMPECEACGGVLEVSDPDDDWEERVAITPAGAAFVESLKPFNATGALFGPTALGRNFQTAFDEVFGLRDHPGEARRLTADFDRLFPLAGQEG